MGYSVTSTSPLTSFFSKFVLLWYWELNQSLYIKLHPMFCPPILRQGLIKLLNCPCWAQTCCSPASASQCAGITDLYGWIFVGHVRMSKTKNLGHCLGCPVKTVKYLRFGTRASRL